MAIERGSSEPIVRTWWIGSVRIIYSRRWNAGKAGRFGGGWSWKLGVQATTDGKSWVFALVFFQLRLDKLSKTRADYLKQEQKKKKKGNA